MKTKYLKWAYMTISAISLLLCAILLWTVFSAEEDVFHAPPGAIISTQKGNTIITEEYLTSGLTAFVPKDFPLGEFTVSIRNEQIIVGTQLKKSDIKNWVKKNNLDLGLKQSLALSFMPKNIDTQICVDIQSDEAEIILNNMQLCINGNYIAVPDAAQKLLVSLNEGINQTLKSSGIQYSQVKIDDGFIELLP